MALTEQDIVLFFQLLESRLELRERLRAIARDQRLEELALAIRELERRMDERFAQLAAAQARTEERLEALAAAQARTEETLRGVIVTMGGMKGQLLEMRYRDRAAAYFGRVLRRVRVVEPHVLEDALADDLSSDELFDALNVDLVVAGTAATHPEKPEVWVAVEVSSVVDSEDVARALRRAALLRRAGRPVVPAVAGEHVDRRALEQPSIERVLVLEDGRVRYWESALAAALAARPAQG